MSTTEGQSLIVRHDEAMKLNKGGCTDASTPNVPLAREAPLAYLRMASSMMLKPTEQTVAPAPRLRVACIGDSLTLGSPEYPNHACSISNKACRGNYPAVLRQMLGARYDLKSFGHDGGVLHTHYIPRGCVPLGLNENDETTRSCQDALRNSTRSHFTLIHQVVAFAPHVAFIQLGTNDAKHFHMLDAESESFGLLAARLRTHQALVGLARVVGAPLTVLLEPPPVVVEAPVGRCHNYQPAFISGGGPYVHRPNPACGSMCPGVHECRYHPRAPYCWRLRGCVDCGTPPVINTSDDKLGLNANQACIRVDMLQHVRAGVRDAAETLNAPTAASHGAITRTHLERLCGSRVAIAAGPAPMTATWGLFFDSVHLSPWGMAMIACHAHRTLAQSCEAHRSDCGERCDTFCGLVTQNLSAALASGRRLRGDALLEALYAAEQRLFNASLASL